MNDYRRQNVFIWQASAMYMARHPAYYEIDFSLVFDGKDLNYRPRVLDCILIIVEVIDAEYSCAFALTISITLILCVCTFFIEGNITIYPSLELITIS